MRSRLLLLAIVVSACSDSPGAPALLEALPRPLSASELRIVGATSDFAFPLLKEINAAQPGDNVFISPLSASMALSMAMNGAADDTYEAMRTSLGFGTIDEAEINQGFRDLIGLLGGLDPTTVFEIANSAWYRDDFTVHGSFLDALTTWFDAEAAALDFDSPAALETINGWVDARTHGRIETILDEIEPTHVMFLINAIYFNGTWRNRFDPAQTIEAPFHALDGSTAQVPLMHQRLTVPYRATADLELVDLPYGNGAFRMTVVLPRDGRDVNEIVASLDRPSWEGLLAGAEEKQVELFLPKFTLEYEREMNDDLKALGMGIMFCSWGGPGAANFSRLSPEGVCVDFVKQKTFVDVHERGTEAAAVTVVAFERTSAPSMPVVRVDRPFIFALRERLSGTILFVGKVVALP